MYWLRRVAVIAAAVVLLVGVVFFLTNRTSRSSAGQDPGRRGRRHVLRGPHDDRRAGRVDGQLAVAHADPDVRPRADHVRAGRERPPAPPPTPPPPTPPPPTPPPPIPRHQPRIRPRRHPPDLGGRPTRRSGGRAAGRPGRGTAGGRTPPAPPPPVYDAQGRLVCADADIRIAAAPAAPAFSLGDQPRLGMTVTNAGAQTCQRDVSGTLQTYTVLALDGSPVWSTADCFPGEGTEVRELTAGQQLSYVVKWSGTTSQPGCAGERTAVPAGDYLLVAQLGALSSAPAPFSITG